MSYLQEKLAELEKITANPNLRGGLWNSFSLFISISDELLKEEAIFKRTSNEIENADEIISELKSIKKNFSETFGFNLESGNGFGEKFIKKKENQRESHKFRKKLTEFIQNYKGHFLRTKC